MKFCICVLFLFINLNHCESANVQRIQLRNDDLDQQSTVSSNKNDTSEIGSVEVLEAPYKSENDEKLYRAIRLNNGLTVLLVSTSQRHTLVDSYENVTQVHPHQKKAACSMFVDVGALSDPRDVQGLAHFVEHMVYNGSKKYPNEHGYEQFIRLGGGSFAEVDPDDTSYRFEAHEEFLDEALDCFSQFFKAPLMSNESMIGEREVIESEFALLKNDDDARHAQLLASLGQNGHPANMFICGNSKTLKENIDDDELYRRFNDFWKRNYSAQRMYLCMQANRSLDNLQELVVQHFSTIPNNDMPDDDFSAFTHLNAFQPKFYEKVFYVKPIRFGSKISITWCLEPMVKNFKSKSMHILSYLLERKEKGSLLSYLRKRLWATELNAWNRKNLFTFRMGYNKLFSFFDIDIHLTENGFDHLDDVFAATFSYLKFLQHAALNESIFRELQSAKMDVKRFSREPDAFENVHELSSQMLQYPSKYFVTFSDYLFNYDASAFKKLIDDINTRKMNIMITLKRNKSKGITYESIEPRFGTMYSEVDMPAKWIELQQKAEPFPEFALPGPNRFIADNFTILNMDEDGDSEPLKILDNGFCTLWYRKDKRISRPHAEFQLLFTRPYTKTSIDNEIQMELLAALLNYKLVEELYPATLVGFKYSCDLHGSGIVLMVKGFNQKIHLVVEIFSKALKSLSEGPTEGEFNVLVQQQFEIYEKEMLNPESLAMEIRSSVVQLDYYPYWERHKHLHTISYVDFQHFCRSFCEQANIEAAAHGNIDKDHALDIVQTLLNNFQCERRIENSTSYTREGARIRYGTTYLRIKNFNANDANSVITNFYQTGTKTIHTQAIMDIYEMVAKGPVFGILRNKEQLSYDVSFNVHNDLGILGYSITVKSQETKFTTDYVDKRIDLFRHALARIIQQMSQDDFDILKNTLARNKWIEYDKLIEDNEWCWHSDREEFDRVHEEVEHLLTITKSQLFTFHMLSLSYMDQRKLSIQVIGNAETDEIGTDSDNINDNFDTLTHVNTTKKVRGKLVEDLMECRNKPGVHYYSDDYEDGLYGNDYETTNETEQLSKESSEEELQPSNTRKPAQVKSLYETMKQAEESSEESSEEEFEPANNRNPTQAKTVRGRSSSSSGGRKSAHG